MSAAELRGVEDEHIKIHVERLLAEGIPDITDGELRRAFFHLDYLRNLDGIHVEEGVLESSGKHVPPTMTVTGKIRHSKNIEVDNFNYLKTLVPAEQHGNIKITIPSPTMLHFRGGRKGISEEAYPDLDDFFADLAAAYREEVQALYDAGCRYLQLDDTNLAYLTDPKMRQDAAARGEDVDALPSRYAKLINASFANRPEDMVIGIHLCKGNFKVSDIAKCTYSCASACPLTDFLCPFDVLPRSRNSLLPVPRRAMPQSPRPSSASSTSTSTSSSGRMSVPARTSAPSLATSVRTRLSFSAWSLPSWPQWRTRLRSWQRSRMRPSTLLEA